MFLFIYFIVIFFFLHIFLIIWGSPHWDLASVCVPPHRLIVSCCCFFFLCSIFVTFTVVGGTF